MLHCTNMNTVFIGSRK